MVRVVAHSGGSKQSEVPILKETICQNKDPATLKRHGAWYFGNVPIEGVKGVEKDKKQPMSMSMIVLYRSSSYVLPQSKQAFFTHTKIVRIRPTLERA